MQGSINGGGKPPPFCSFWCYKWENKRENANDRRERFTFQIEKDRKQKEKARIHNEIGLLQWRRWRDSNSRRAFDPYTISNRARSTNYATSPCCSRMRLFNCQLAHYNAAFRQSQGIFYQSEKRIRRKNDPRLVPRRRRRRGRERKDDLACAGGRDPSSLCSSG